MILRKALGLTALCIIALNFGQSKKAVHPAPKKPTKVSAGSAVKPDLAKLNDSVAALIPYKTDGKFGFKNQKGLVVIPRQYSNAGFFYEDCNLLNSPNPKLRKFGSADYASVRDAAGDFRIDAAGRKVYRYKDEDLGRCPAEFKQQLYHAYMKGGFFGIVEDARFADESDYRQFQIYPQYEYLHILEGDDLHNPMIIASYKDRFGVIDKDNKVVVPFEYADIKRNFSWKIARLFEVTKDGTNYYFVDDKNHAY